MRLRPPRPAVPAQREALGDSSILSGLGDVHDIGPRGHLDAGRDLQDRIDTLNEHGLIVYAGTRTLTLTGGERDSPWREAVLKVVHERDACVTTPCRPRRRRHDRRTPRQPAVDTAARERTAILTPPDWRMNACVNWGGGTLYSDGYKTAADTLVNQVAADRYTSDTLVYPIVFCYRQYLELLLKALLEEARLRFHIDEGIPVKHQCSSSGSPYGLSLSDAGQASKPDFSATTELLSQFDDVERPAVLAPLSPTAAASRALPAGHHPSTCATWRTSRMPGSFLEALLRTS